MTARLGEDFLVAAGLGDLAADDRCRLLRTVARVLEQRVGYALADRLSAEQLQEFDALEPAAARGWLDGAVPEHRQLVRRELSRLREELARDAVLLLELGQRRGQSAP